MNPKEPKQPDRQKAHKDIPDCPQRQAIAAELLKHIDDYVKLTFQQIEFLKAGDHQSALDLDLELHRKNGERQRAFGALLQHIEEHHC